MWTDESWSGEAEEELVSELGRARRAPLSRPRPGSRSPFPRPKPWPPRQRRGGSLLYWDEPLPATACWRSPDLDDPEALESLRRTLNQLFDQLVRRARRRG